MSSWFVSACKAEEVHSVQPTHPTATDHQVARWGKTSDAAVISLKMQGPARVNVAVREPQLPLQDQRRPPNSQRIHFEPRFKMDKVNVQMDRIWRWIHIEYQATAIWGAVADTDNFAGGRSCNLCGLHRHIACEWNVLHRVASTFDALCSFPFSCGDCGDFEHHRHPFLQEFARQRPLGHGR